MPPHLTLRAAGIAAFITLSGTAAMGFPGCDGSDALHARDLHGNWFLDDGGANVSGFRQGSDGETITLSAVANNITLTIDGRRIGLSRTNEARDAILWPSGPQAAISAEDLEIVIGCRLDELPRWAQRTEVSAEGRTSSVYWRLFAMDRDWAILQYDLPGAPGARAYFQIVR